MADDQAQPAEIVATPAESAPPYPPQECGAEIWVTFILRGSEIVELWTCTRDRGHSSPHENEIDGEIGGRRWIE